MKNFSLKSIGMMLVVVFLLQPILESCDKDKDDFPASEIVKNQDRTILDATLGDIITIFKRIENKIEVNPDPSTHAIEKDTADLNKIYRSRLDSLKKKSQYLLESEKLLIQEKIDQIDKYVLAYKIKDSLDKTDTAVTRICNKIESKTANDQDTSQLKAIQSDTTSLHEWINTLQLTTPFNADSILSATFDSISKKINSYMCVFILSDAASGSFMTLKKLHEAYIKGDAKSEIKRIFALAEEVTDKFEENIKTLISNIGEVECIFALNSQQVNTNPKYICAIYKDTDSRTNIEFFTFAPIEKFDITEIKSQYSKLCEVYTKEGWSAYFSLDGNTKSEDEWKSGISEESMKAGVGGYKPGASSGEIWDSGYIGINYYNQMGIWESYIIINDNTSSVF